MPPGWYILYRSCHLKQQPRRFVHAGVGLAAFRTASGVASVVEDRCAHRTVIGWQSVRRSPPVCVPRLAIRQPGQARPCTPHCLHVLVAPSRPGSPPGKCTNRMASSGSGAGRVPPSSCRTHLPNVSKHEYRTSDWIGLNDVDCGKEAQFYR